MGFWDSVFAIPNAFLANLRGDQVTTGTVLFDDSTTSWSNDAAFVGPPAPSYLPGKSPTDTIARAYELNDATFAWGLLPGGAPPDPPGDWPDPEDLKDGLQWATLALVGVGLLAVSR